MSTKCQFINASFSISFLDGSAPFTGDLTLLGFNVSLGIGDGSAVLDLSLIVNPCIGNNNWTATGVGRPLFFKCLTTGFSFNGIINSATLTDGPNGKILNYKIIDPRKLLDSATVLLKDYYCNITAPNFFNFAYFQEGQYCANCPPSPNTETWPDVRLPCSGYGTSGIGLYSSQNGISLLKVLNALQGAPIYSTAGLSQDVLTLNLSALIGAVASKAPWSKTDSSSMSVGEIIAQAAKDAACDFITTIDDSGFIVVWPINRSVIITGNPIDAIIAQYKASGTLITSESGRNEIYESSHKIVIGDHVTYMSEVDCRNSTANMMLGYDLDGSPIRASGANFTANINTSSLRALKGLENFPLMTPISEMEILCSKTTPLWIIYGVTNHNSLSYKLLDALGLAEEMQNSQLLEAFNKLLGANPNNADTVNGWKEALAQTKSAPSSAAKKFNYTVYVQAWNWFQEFINTYYGKKWLVPIKGFCIYPKDNPQIIIGEGGPYQISDFPTDSGYPSANQIANGILGINATNAEVFEASDGKYNGFTKIDLTKNYTRKITKDTINFRITMDQMSPGSFVVQDNALFMKITSNGEVYNNNGNPEVLVETPLIPMVPRMTPENQNDFINRGLMACAVLFGKDKFSQRGQQQGYLDVSKLNMFQLHNLAAEMDFVAIPMKSNMYVYGPWYSEASGQSNCTSTMPTSIGSVIGSTEVVVDSQINPWSYGSYEAMNLAGCGLASMGLRLYNTEFTGSFKIAEPPGNSITDFINNYGLLVSNITVNYNEGGVTTEYSFKTFVPRFGQPGQVISEMMLKSAQQRSAVSSHFKDLRRKSLSEMYSLRINLEKTVMKEFEDTIDRQKTPMFIMVGGYRGSDTNNYGSGGSSFDPVGVKQKLVCPDDICKEVPPPGEPPDGSYSIQKIPDIDLQKEEIAELSFPFPDNRYKQKAVMSLDGLFTPVSLGGRSYYRIGIYYQGWGDGAFRSRPPMPPFKERLSINQKYLNPIVSSTILGNWDSRASGSYQGFYIQYISFGDDVTKIHNDYERQSATDFGFMALRGPLVLQSWGYDTEGKPIPNIIDSPAMAENGIFKKDGTKNKFMKDWLGNPKTWPVGPIDLRFDRDRGVWVAPTQERIVVAELMGALSPYGAATAALLNPQSGGGKFYDNYAIYGPNGENYGKVINTIKIPVCDFLGRNLCAGTRIYAYYNDDKYIVLESSVVNETSCAEDECLCTSSSSSSSSSESSSEPCPDYCGLNSCLSSIPNYKKSLDQLLGHDQNGCLVWFDFVVCPTPTPFY